MDPLGPLDQGRAGAQRLGSVDIGEVAAFRSKGQVIRNFVIALLLAVLAVGGLGWAYWPRLLSAGVAVLCFAAYAAAAYFIRARPNHDDLGPLAGALAVPFRRTQDVNRALVSLALALAPGRFVSISLVEGYRYFRTGRLPQDRWLAKLDASPPE